MDGAADRPTFPPLLAGARAPAGTAALDAAVADARAGCDAGRVVWSARADAMEAALVLAPEAPLGRAISVVVAPALGLVDALGALGPPELAVQHVWPGRFRVNGALCGGLRAAASTDDPAAEPDWLVVGIEVPFLPGDGSEGGEDPGRTCLFHEGCGDIAPAELLESWSRHTLHWINRWLSDGARPLHAAWCARAWGLGEPIGDGSGSFTGLDEDGGMLVRTAAGTTVCALTAMLEGP